MRKVMTLAAGLALLAGCSQQQPPPQYGTQQTTSGEAYSSTPPPNPNNPNDMSMQQAQPGSPQYGTQPPNSQAPAQGTTQGLNQGQDYNAQANPRQGAYQEGPGSYAQANPGTNAQPAPNPAGAQSANGQPPPQDEYTAADPAQKWHGDLLHAALDLPSLTPTQQTQVRALVARCDAANANVRAAHTQLLNAIAEGLDAGSVNASGLAPKTQLVVAAIQAAEPTDRTLLENLHAVLTPDQRTALVNAVQAQAQQNEEQGGNARNERRVWLAKELNLTPSEEDQIHANLSSMEQASAQDHSQMKADHERVLQAFESDSFVMNQVVPMKNTDAIQRRVNRLVLVAQAAAPVLTPEQRTTAASIVRSWASKPLKR